jgi:selenocysteine lyase/cysteine desulfurase
LLIGAGLGTAAAAFRERRVEGSESPAAGENPAPAAAPDEWDAVRAQFRLSPEYIHLAGLLLASHPTPVREAIERHRLGLDESPPLYIRANNQRLQMEAREAAAQYLGARRQEIALTDSTTMGLGLVYNGLEVRAGQELLASTSDYYATHESLRYKAARSGASLRAIRLYQNIGTVSEEEIVTSLIRAVRPETRVIAVTWVHSSTGLKFPVRRLADALAPINDRRAPADRVLLCVDGVHGLGVENATVLDLGCDFFMAGTHKWLFGPRGSGLIWGHPRSQAACSPTIPTFTHDGTWGGGMSPGGYKPFEHLWSVAEAFRLHLRLGKARVAERIHALNRQLKEGLAAMPHVRLYTPIDERLSAGITCFDVEGLSPGRVVERLRQQKIIASTTPYTPSYARLTPGLLNTPAEVEQALRAIRELA